MHLSAKSRIFHQFPLFLLGMSIELKQTIHNKSIRIIGFSNSTNFIDLTCILQDYIMKFSVK